MRSECLDTEEQSVGLISERMEARAEHLKSRNYRSLYSIATAVGGGLLVMVLTWLIRFRKGFSWTDTSTQFNWHPFLMILGMIFIYGQSILVYRTGRSSSKKRLKILHAVLHVITFVLAVIALKAVFDSHNYAKPPIPNLYTLHSWFGLLTVIIFSAQFLSGFVSFLYPGLAPTLRRAILPVHVATGTATFVLALFSALTGTTEKVIWTLGKDYSGLPNEGVLVNFIALFIGIFGVLVLYLVNDKDFKRPVLPEDEVALDTSD